MKVRHAEVVGEVVPAAHVGAGRCDAGLLAKWLEERVFVECSVEGVIGLELLAERPLEKLNIGVAILSERCRRSSVGREGAAWGSNGCGGESCAGFEEGSAGISQSDGPLFGRNQSLFALASFVEGRRSLLIAST
jgi:hypothetical protein